jgi:hypothetical protein
VNKLFQVMLLQRLGKKRHAELTARPAYRVVAQSLALAYFVLALAFLWPVRPDMLGVSAGSMVAGAFIVLAICAMLAVLTRVRGDAPFAVPRVLLPAAIAVELTAAVAYLWISGGAVPDLLYQRL